MDLQVQMNIVLFLAFPSGHSFQWVRGELSADAAPYSNQSLTFTHKCNHRRIKLFVCNLSLHVCIWAWADYLLVKKETARLLYEVLAMLWMHQMLQSLHSPKQQGRCQWLPKRIWKSVEEAAKLKLGELSYMDRFKKGPWFGFKQTYSHIIARRDQ